MLLNRRIIRTILNTTETTDSTKDVNDDALSFVFTTADFFYIGFPRPFASRFFQMGVANTNVSVLTIEYWDGTTWKAVDDLVDQTSGMTANGFISWINQTDWQTLEQTPVTSTNGNDLKLYWVRLTTNANFSAGTTIAAVLNLFSDDNSIRSLYPEIISDTRNLPPGRTDFLEQHIEAKNRVVRRLKQKGIITEESDIIDINEVAEAASHAFADIVLSPISTSEAMLTIRNTARSSFEAELTRVNLGADVNKDGRITNAERLLFTGSITRA